MMYNYYIIKNSCLYINSTFVDAKKFHRKGEVNGLSVFGTAEGGFFWRESRSVRVFVEKP